MLFFFISLLLQSEIVRREYANVDVAYHKRKLHEAYDALEQYLAGQEYMAGDEVSFHHTPALCSLIEFNVSLLWLL